MLEIEYVTKSILKRFAIYIHKLKKYLENQTESFVYQSKVTSLQIAYWSLMLVNQQYMTKVYHNMLECHVDLGRALHRQIISVCCDANYASNDVRRHLEVAFTITKAIKKQNKAL